MKEIKLTRGLFAIVDDEDFEELNKFSWHASASGYAVRKIGNENIHMHRLINKTPCGLQTDHINRNRTDNRKKNLRTVTNQQNSFNKKTYKNNKSGINGIHWDKSRNRWKAFITFNGKMINIGRYKKIEDALSARIEAEKKYISFPF